jgi:phosphatidylserine/phosphatidylglycerophosphate/cardiolipin synthase-like enzyme
MKKNLFLLINLIVVHYTSLNAQVLTIADVQGRVAVSPYVNQVVTIKGAVTGAYSAGYFIRDSEEAWSGMYIYDQGHKPALGDTIQVTATVAEYYEWTELKTVTAYTLISTGNPAPEPVLIVTGDIDESWENCLVTVKKAKCTKTTLGYGEWEIDDGSGTAVVNDLGYAFTPQLDENYNITGNVSFSFLFYKIEPRFAADVEIAATIFINSEVYPSVIDKNSITLTWTTNVPGTTEVSWGNTPDLELGDLADTSKTLSHTVTIEGLSPAGFYYIKPFSVFGTDVTRSVPVLFSTASESTGEMRVCFNQAGIPPKDTDPPGIYTASMIDTMAAYVNLAQSTLDLALYDFTNHASFSDERNIGLVDAINAAFQRGVTVRFISDANVKNEVLANLDPGIPILKVKTAAIMHDKFMIVDRESVTNSWLISGSTNPTYNNLVMDFNNLIAIQDQSVAKAYNLEFNEMYGSSGASPDTLKSLISLNKKDNTPHYFSVNGKRIEVYFSPSDFTTSHMVTALNLAETRIDFAMMAFTEDPLGNALVNAKARGIKVKGIIDYIEYSGSEYTKLLNAGVNVLDYKNPDGLGWPDAPTLHHKFAVVDAGTPNATVITGSHNWTAAADSKNDENTLIIHDTGIAELYKAESERIYRWLRPMTCNNDSVEALDQSQVTINVLANDSLPANYSFSIIKQPVYGIATIVSDSSISFVSMLNCICDLKDTIIYQVCYGNDPDYCLQASVFIALNVTKPILCNNDTIITLDQNLLNISVIANDILPENFSFSIIRQPDYGTATVETDFSINYESTLCCDFKHIRDTIVYQICDTNAPLNCGQASVYITLDFTESINELESDHVRLWPNPVFAELSVKSEKPVSRLEILDVTGKSLLIMKPLMTEFMVQMPVIKGIYFIRITMYSGEMIMKKVVKF